MVSSISHILRGNADPFTLVVASGFSLWWLGCHARRISSVVWFAVGIAPILLLPDYKLPIDDYLPSAVTGPMHAAAAAMLTNTGLLAAAATGLVMVLMSRRQRRQEYYVVDETIGERLKVVTKTSPTEKATPEFVADVVADMRASFMSGISLPVETRKAQLRALRQFFVDQKENIIAALAADLDRPRLEAIMYDWALPVAEIDNMLADLDDYLEPEPCEQHILSFPAKQYLQPDPLGVALIIGTWNFPLQLELVPLIGAIAAGNTAIVKPCVISRNCAELVQRELPKYLDPRIVHVLGAFEERDSPVTNELLKHKFDVIFFTGSPKVGRVIMEGAAKNLTPCILELGGKNPVYVDKSADVTLAAKRCVWGRNLNAGQQCISPDFVLCHEAVLDKFLSECRRFVAEFYGPDPSTSGSVGKIVGERQIERIADLIETTKGKFVVGGDYNKETRYVAPTVAHVAMDDVLMEDEIFGPILAVVGVPNAQAALTEIRSRPEPLALYVFAEDKTTQELFLHNTASGGVTVNHCIFHVANVRLPFGGVGNSGMGSYHAKKTFDAFSHPKPVVIKSKWADFGIISDPFYLYPPWNSVKEWILSASQPLI